MPTSWTKRFTEPLVELLAVVALQDRQDAVGGCACLVDALRTHGVVDVGDAAERRSPG
jgi:hypothetical protein